MSTVLGTASVRPVDRSSVGPTHVGVVVSARGGAGAAARCLESVRAARSLLPSAVVSEVLVVPGPCTATVAALLSELPALAGVAADCAWLAWVDGARTVPRDWLTGQLDLAVDGAVLVTSGPGTIGVRLDALRCVAESDSGPGPHAAPTDEADLVHRLRTIGVLPVPVLRR